MEPTDGDALQAGAEEAVDLDHIRPDLASLLERRGFGENANRPEAVKKRHSLGFRTARENVADLVDEGSFVEYGGLAIAAEGYRRTEADLIENTPADGLITGVGSINGELVDEAKSRCVVMAYDYTVLAGTQATNNHRKMDRMLEIARTSGLPVVLFSEGGGGRPGDVDVHQVAGLDTSSFSEFADSSAARCPWWVSIPGAASRATPYYWDVAMSS